MSEPAQNTNDETTSTGTVTTRLAWSLWFLAMAIAAAGLVLLALNWPTPVSMRWGFRGFQPSYAIPTATVGALIAWGRPRNPIGWILLAGGICGALAGFSEEYAVYTLLTRPSLLPAGAIIAGLGHWLWVPAYGLLAIHVPLLFPDGRFLTLRWRIIAWLGAAWVVLGSLWLFLRPGPLENISFIDNPFGVEELKASLFWSPPPSVTALGPGVLLMAAAAISLVFRFRQSGKEVRQQLKWLAYAATLMPFIGIVGQFDGLVPNLLLFIFTAAFPVAVGIAILRHRLYDIDVLINRTLVYGALTASIVGLYALLVGSAGMVLQTNSTLAGLLLTGVLAVAVFRPVRAFVQRGVNRVMYGQGTQPREFPRSELSTDVETRAGVVDPQNGISAARLEGVWLRAARIAWVIFALAALGLFFSSLPGYALKMSGNLPGHGGMDAPTTSTAILKAASALASLGSAVLSLTLSGLLFRRRFEEPATAAISFYLLLYGVVMAGVLEAWGIYWVGNMDFVVTLQGFLLATPTVALFVLFPNGRFIPGWTRWVLLASIPWNVILFFIPPLSALDAGFSSLLTLFVLWFVSIPALGLYAQVYRYRYVSTPDERQQTKWVLFGFALWSGYIILSTYPFMVLTNLPPGTPNPWWAPLSELGWWVSLNFLPVSMAIAITRYRLWDVDVVVNRTLVYGALTASVVALYVLVVGGLGLLFQTSNSLLIPLLATGLAAALFQPLRERLQRGVNRLMYGERDDPYTVLARLGQRLEAVVASEAVLPAIVETVAQALKLPYAAIALKDADAEAFRVVAEASPRYGRSPDRATPGLGPSAAPSATLRAGLRTGLETGPSASGSETFPLRYQNETVGQLILAPRAPGEEFSRADQRLLRNIARQAGAAAHAVRLTADLQRSREDLVTAREEERRRLRRDLHDGLGPRLAGLTLRLDAARNLLADDPATTDTLLAELKTEVQAAIGDIRDLVYNLRPPALDELGLVSAIRENAMQHAAVKHGLHISVEAPPEGLPALSAAVEVAAYRIALEALTNTARHAQAQHCVIRFSVDEAPAQADSLQLEIMDDGRGLPESYRLGVGFASMRERAEELGGTCEFLAALGGGTRVMARLPLTREM